MNPSGDPHPSGQARGLAFPRAGRYTTPRLLHAYIATAPRPNAAPSLVLVDESARTLETVPLERLPLHGIARRPAADEPGAAAGHSLPAARSHLAFRGFVHALWRARRLGYRRIAVHSDDPAAVAQINGDRPVDGALVGAYLQARALMHLYKSAVIDVGELMTSPAAAACAMSASS